MYPTRPSYVIHFSTKGDSVAAATAQTRPSNGVPVAGRGGSQWGRLIVLRQLLLW